MNYELILEPIDMNLLIPVFENARKQSSDIVIIPRFLNSIYNGFEIGGIQSQTIIVTSKYNNFVNIQNTPLWSNESLSYISMYSKDIPPYLKLIRDNNLTDFYLEIHKYMINGVYISIATKLVSSKQILMKLNNEEFAEPELVNPTILLLPYLDSLRSIKLMIYKFETSFKLTQMALNMKDDEDFIEIWNGSATEGSRAWVPNIEKYDKSLSPYILYLAKSMFTFSKSDQVNLQLSTNIIGERSDIFLAKFNVIRKKKSLVSIHDYYVSGYKL